MGVLCDWKTCLSVNLSLQYTQYLEITQVQGLQTQEQIYVLQYPGKECMDKACSISQGFRAHRRLPWGILS